jgi:hypothetical protein
MILFYLVFGILAIFFAGVNLGMGIRQGDLKDWFISAMGAFFGIYLIISAIGRIVI